MNNLSSAKSIEFLHEYCKDLPRGECYILCILSRKKNNENMPDSHQIMKRRLIFAHSDIKALYDELLLEREMLNQYDFYMYVTASPRSIRKALVMFISECVDILSQYMTDDGQIRRVAKLSHIWYSILQKPEARGSLKRYIIDIDTKDANVLCQITKDVEMCGSEVLYTRATRNGYHVICTPFDTQAFTGEFIEYKRDGLVFVQDM